MTKEQQQKLDATLTNLQKKYGKGSISVFGRNQIKVERFPVSSMNLTEMMGGGFPRGRMIEIYGPESSGKTTLAEYFGGQCQNYYYEDKQRNGVVAYIDVEHALDPDYAESIGLKMKDVIFSQPDSAEQALDIVNDLLLSDVVDLIVVDSVAALLPQAEADGEMGVQQMGLQARLMSKACRKLQANMTEKSASIIFINQIREKIGVMFGNPETTTGGNALKFYASIRFTIRRKEYVTGMNSDDVIGIVSTLKTIKNKVASPFKTCEMKLLFGKGYQVEEEYVVALTKKGLIEKSGSWYSWSYKDPSGKEGSHREQGLDNVITWFKGNPVIFEQFKRKIQEMIAKESNVVSEKEENEEEVIKQQTKLEKEEFADLHTSETSKSEDLATQALAAAKTK